MPSRALAGGASTPRPCTSPSPYSFFSPILLINLFPHQDLEETCSSWKWRAGFALGGPGSRMDGTGSCLPGVAPRGEQGRAGPAYPGGNEGVKGAFPCVSPRNRSGTYRGSWAGPRALCSVPGVHVADGGSHRAQGAEACWGSTQKPPRAQPCPPHAHPWLPPGTSFGAPLVHGLDLHPATPPAPNPSP